MIDRYQVGRCIGRGGMAEVYHGVLARMGGFARDVAVKILLPQLSGEPEFVNMLMDEARIAATINHPNVVQVLDVGQDGDTCYLVMEYVDGTDLRSLEKRHEGGRVPAEPLLFIIAEVLRGLQAIHGAKDAQGRHQKVVHRDVTPSNVLLTRSGVVKLADFGIAHATGRLTQTRHGAVKGKTRYMAPEQLDGRNIDPRTDMFAVGVLLLEALLGRDAADAWQATAMGPIFKMPVRIPPAVPLDIGAMLQRALRERPDDRYESAAVFRKDVLRALHARSRPDQVDYGPDDLMAFIQNVLSQPDPGPKASQVALPQPEEDPSASVEPSLLPSSATPRLPAAAMGRGSAPPGTTLGEGDPASAPTPQSGDVPPYSDPFPTQNLSPNAPADPPTMRVTSRPPQQPGLLRADSAVPPGNSALQRILVFSGPPGPQAGATQSMESVRVDAAAGRLPLLSVENDVPTATAAKPSVKEDVEFSTVPGKPLPALPDLPQLLTSPMMAVADLVSATPGGEQTLSMRGAIEVTAQPLSTLASDDPADGQLVTAVNAPPPLGFSQVPQTDLQPALMEEGYTGITVPPARRSGSMREAIGHAMTMPGQLFQSTIVKAAQSTIVKAARNQLPLRLLVMVLSGLLVASIGLLVLYKVQGQTHGPIASPQVPETHPDKPVQPTQQKEPSRPQRGQLQLDFPPGTKVFIDNIRQQSGPHTYELPPGQHLVRYALPHHREVTRAVELRAGSEVRLSGNDK